jgi:O-antigen/teichoic acid export membrane protein
MILSRVVILLTGFFFWIVAARFYSIQDVGLAVILIYSTNIVVLISAMGLDFSIVRFISKYDVNKVFSTCIILVAISSLIVGSLYIFVVGFLTPSVPLLRDPVYIMIFVAYSVLITLFAIVGKTFIGTRQSRYYLLQNAIQSSRLLLLIPLAFLGTFGIFGADLLAYVISLLIVSYVLARMIKFEFNIDLEFIKKSIRFSSTFFLSNAAYSLPFFLLPIIVLNILGQESSTRYYIALTIGNFLIQIADIISLSLLVEGAHGENIRSNMKKALVYIYSILIPAFLFIFLFGNYVLGIFGKDYVAAFSLLKLVAFSSFFYVICSIYVSIQNVKLNLLSVLKLYVVMSIVFTSLSVYFIRNIGLDGVGYAMIITYALLSVVILASTIRQGWLQVNLKTWPIART